MIPSRIYLIGYRGSGKSEVGRILAGRLGWPFVDIDEAIEKRHGRTIRQIFADQGEGEFRILESQELLDASRLSRTVIATGGGIILSEANRQCLRQSGYIVWLKASPPVLWNRIQSDAATAEHRPNLTVGGLPEIEQLLKVREPLYGQCAELIIDTDSLTAPHIAEAILKKLNLPAVT